VAMPERNSDFNQLALGLAATLPRSRLLPPELERAKTWQGGARYRLKTLVRWRDRDVVAEEVPPPESSDSAAGQGGITTACWRLKIGDAWTVPVVEFTPANASSTTLVVADAGRQSLAAKVAKRLQAGERVLAFDPFYVGESHITDRDFLYALLISAVGDRPLGIQAAQLAAVAEWAKSRHPGKLTLAAEGERLTLAALVAGGINPEGADRLEITGSLGSLHEVLERNGGVDQTPELFCFGLLEQLDIVQIAALMAPRQVVVVDPSERSRQTLAELKDWYGLWGKTFDPLATP